MVEVNLDSPLSTSTKRYINYQHHGLSLLASPLQVANRITQERNMYFFIFQAPSACLV